MYQHAICYLQLDSAASCQPPGLASFLLFRCLSVSSSMSASEMTEVASPRDQASDLLFLAAHSISLAGIATVQAGPWPQTLRFYHDTHRSHIDH